MRYPEFLKENGSIGFPAPSFGCASEPYYSALNNAFSKLREKGFLLYPGTNSFREEGVGISNTPIHCGGELTAMYMDPDIDAYISCGGGELMCETLDFIDFEKIKGSKPKWFMGYSDNTNFTFLSATIADTASIYGPCASSFGMEPWHAYIQDALFLMMGKKLKFDSYDKWELESFKGPEEPLAPINPTEDRVHAIYANGELIKDARKSDVELSFTGRIIGGCMDCMINLLGTNFDHVADFNEKYAEDGIIWFMEACDLNVFAIRRAMWQMSHAGWFKNVKGFLIGRPANGADMMNLDRFEAVLDTCRKMDVPVVMDVDLGHRNPMIPVMVGSVATVSIHGNDMSIEYSLK